MPLQIMGPTSGSVTIQPTDTTTSVLTLPANTGTILSTANPQSGGVIQTVSSTNQQQNFSTSSTTFVALGISISITPKFASSKILVSFSGGMLDNGAGGNQALATICRNGTNLGATVAGMTGNYGVSRVQTPFSLQYLDSPATTSSTTYAIYVASGYGTIYYNGGGNTFLASITAQEIAA